MIERKLVLGKSSVDTLYHQKEEQWVREQNKPETSLKAKMTKPKLSYFGHTIIVQGALEKTIMLGKREGSRKRERPNMRCAHSIKEGTGVSLQQLSRAVDRRLWTSLIHSVTRNWI